MVGGGGEGPCCVRYDPCEIRDEAAFTRVPETCRSHDAEPAAAGAPGAGPIAAGREEDAR
jgi:hypothetical protein